MPKPDKETNTRTYISPEEEARLIAEMHEKAETDRRVLYARARELGTLEELIASKEEIAKTLFQAGINDIHLISAVTNLTGNELMKIKQQLSLTSEEK